MEILFILAGVIGRGGAVVIGLLLAVVALGIWAIRNVRPIGVDDETL